MDLLGFCAEAPFAGMGSGNRWPIFVPSDAVMKGFENNVLLAARYKPVE